MEVEKQNGLKGFCEGGEGFLKACKGSGGDDIERCNGLDGGVLDIAR